MEWEIGSIEGLEQLIIAERNFELSRQSKIGGNCTERLHASEVLDELMCGLVEEILEEDRGSHGTVQYFHSSCFS